VRSVNKADVPRMTCSFTVSKVNAISILFVYDEVYKGCM
jgi:hypothetical protein